MSFLVVTIPVTLLLAAALLGLVLHAVRSGDFDDLDAPAARMLHDDDATPELDAPVRLGAEPPDEDGLAAPPQ